MAVPFHTHTFELPVADEADIAAGHATDKVVVPAALGSAAIADMSDFATAAQGAKADTAVQLDQLGALALKDKVSVGDIGATGIADQATVLHGDGAWRQITGGGGQGGQGPKGDKGDKGEKGDPGLSGEKGEKGDKGEKGAKGDKGDKGDTGAQGPAGPPGSGGSGTGGGSDRAYANLVINGDFSVDQRGFKGSMAGGMWSYDRWRVVGNSRVQYVEHLSAGTYALYWDGGGNGTLGSSPWAPSPRLATLATAGKLKCSLPSSARNICLIKVASMNDYPATNPFHPRPFVQELALCQRYYQKSSPYDIKAQNNLGAGLRLPTTIWTNSNTAPAGKITAYLNFPTRMASAPTIKYYDPTTGAEGIRVLDEEGNTFGFIGVEEVAATETYAILANQAAVAADARYFTFNYEADAEIIS